MENEHFVHSILYYFRPWFLQCPYMVSVIFKVTLKMTMMSGNRGWK
jgi:hypothetical protein